MNPHRDSKLKRTKPPYLEKERKQERKKERRCAVVELISPIPYQKMRKIETEDLK